MLLEVKDVGKTYGGLRALEAVNLKVSAGEIVGIMGANGAGKTTLFSLIAGNQRPSRGELIFDGQRLDRLRPDRISRLGVARTFQIVRPFAALTVLENVAIGAMFGSRRLSSQAAGRRAREVLEEVGLEAESELLAGALTLADCKRLEIARALATGPRLLLLDEVMAGLSETEVAEALELIRALQQRYDLTILVIEHVMQALMRLCQRIVVLHHGQMLAQGSPEEIAEHPEVIKAYLGDAA